LWAVKSASDLPHLTLQQFLHLQGLNLPVYQVPICKDPDRSTASPIAVAYPDNLDISPSSTDVSGTLSPGPDTANLNTPSGLFAFFPQGAPPI
jgi:hypothetical protein